MLIPLEGFEGQGEEKLADSGAGEAESDVAVVVYSVGGVLAVAGGFICSFMKSITSGMVGYGYLIQQAA